MVDGKLQSERGQVLVFLVVGVVVFLGFTALAIDGGLILSERRNAQNAADASALAAGLAKINGQNWQQIGFDRARSNGYENANPAVNVVVNSPPVSGQYQGLDQYIQVLIDSQVNTAFAHFVFGGPLVTSVEAIARAKPTSSLMEGNALVAINDQSCSAMTFGGNIGVFVDGGGIFSNSNGGNGKCDAGVSNGGVDVTVSPPDVIGLVGSFKENGSGNISPAPGSNHNPIQLDPVQSLVSICASYPAGSVSSSGKTETYTPGSYNDIQVSKSNIDVVLLDGLYCIQNDFKVTGGSITGDDVTIYIISGGFETGGNTLVKLDAPEKGDPVVPPAMPGMLIYLAPGNAGPVKLTGTSGSSFEGTVYAPDALVTIHGTSGTLAVNSQIIGDEVDIGGTADILIQFNPADNYPAPPRVELAK